MNAIHFMFLCLFVTSLFNSTQARHSVWNQFFTSNILSDTLPNARQKILRNVMESLEKNKGPQTDSLFCRGYYQDSLGLLLYVGDEKISIEHFGPRILRFSVDTVEFPAIRNQQAIIGKKTNHQFLAIDAGEFFQFRSIGSNIHLLVQKQPFSISVFKDSLLVFKEDRGLFFKSHSRGLSISLRQDEGIFGGGSQSLSVNRRGHAFPIISSFEYGEIDGSNELNIGIPFFISTSKYGILIDSPIACALDCGKSDNTVMQFAQTHEKMSYFLIIDSSYEAIMNHSTELMGTQSLPPLWSLGFIQSMNAKASQSEVLKAVQDIQQTHVPLDAIVIDELKMESTSKDGIAVNTKNWPDPLGMMKSLQKKNIQTIFINGSHYTKRSSMSSVDNNVRVFNLTLSGGPGMQRYSTFPWSGDVQRSASGLQAQIPIMLGMSMSGIGYMHSDLGGFTGGAKNERLYARWMQFGAFTPIMRAHGEGIPPEPIYYSDSIKNIVTYFIKLRLQFLPYNYTLAFQNAKHGTPLARPIFWNGPSSKEFTEVNDQYLWGNDVMIAPILHPDSTSRKVLLPAGTWFDFWSNYKIPGMSNFTMPAPLNIIPVFVKGGSVLPLTFPINNTAQFKGDSLLLIYFRDTSITNVSSNIYLDDGLSSSSVKNGEYRLLEIQVKEDISRKSISFSMNTIEGKGFAGEPASRMIISKWIDVPKPLSITYGKSSIPLAKDEKSFYTAPMPIAWYKKSQNPALPNELHIRFTMGQSTMNDLIMKYQKIEK